MFALCFPEQHGGTGTGTLTFLRAVEELSWADATVGLILAVQSLGAAAIELAGSSSSRRIATCRAGRAVNGSPPTP